VGTEETSPVYDTGTKKATLIIATLSAFMTPFVGSSVNIALPSIGKEFQMNAVLLSWIPTSYLLAAATSLVPFGRLADIYGRKKFFTYGLVLFILSTLLCAASFSAPTLILFRVLQGIGGAMIFAPGMAILTSVFPASERGKVLGINVAAVYTGLSLGPILGGFLTQHFSWRSVFLVNVPLGLVTVFFVLWKLKGEWAEAKGEKFDWIGSLVYILGIIGFMYGISSLPGTSSLWMIMTGLLALSAFVKWELRVGNPVFQLSLFKENRVFAFSNLAALIHYSASFAVTFLLSLYLQHIKGYGPQKAGLVLIFQPVVMAAFSPLAGRLSDRIEPRIVSSIGMAMTSVGLLFFSFLDQHTSLVSLVSVLVLHGLGFALFSSPNTNAVMSSVEKRFYGIASGSVGTMRLLGQALSMGIATLMFSLFMGRVQISEVYHGVFQKSLKAAFLIFCTLCFFGIFASLVRGRVRPGPSERRPDTPGQ
jgi:EmrB/QacA subfamily drug resistance transporter